jgi:hypothetical protein
MKVAESALYRETILANCVAMRAARNERHIMSSRGHQPAEIASHGTRCHDPDPHLAPSAAKIFVSPKIAASPVAGSAFVVPSLERCMVLVPPAHPSMRIS